VSFNVGREALNFEDEGASPSAAAVPLNVDRIISSNVIACEAI
jgi:hypothetical protein